MKTTFKLLLIALIIQACQPDLPPQKHPTSTADSVNFDTLITYLKDMSTEQKHLNIKIDLPLVCKYYDYSVEISRNPLPLALDYIIVKNPYGEQFPVAYSVIYNDRLITILSDGYISCLSTSNFERDIEYEKILNTQKILQINILDNKLVGTGPNKHYYLDAENNWVEYPNYVPFGTQIKLYEDEVYISFCDCHGEFGGTVYFYNKQTRKLHFAYAVCANSIIKENDAYYVVSYLAHMGGSSSIQKIPNPELLPTIKLNTSKNYRPDYYKKQVDIKIKNNSHYTGFELIRIYAGFIYNNRRIYFVNWAGQAFLAEIDNDIIRIINPLFNRDIHINRARAERYGNTILINAMVWGKASNLRLCNIIIKDGKLTMLDWAKQQ